MFSLADNEQFALGGEYHWDRGVADPRHGESLLSATLHERGELCNRQAPGEPGISERLKAYASMRGVVSTAEEAREYSAGPSQPSDRK